MYRSFWPSYRWPPARTCQWPGDALTVSLVPDYSSFYADNGYNTSVNFSGNSGTITIGPSSAAVPEPGSLALKAA